jgi:hypothetical protein
MEAAHIHPSEIEKEKISSLVFPKNEVLSDSESIAKRKSNLDAGLKLGNNFHNKVKIIFEDSEGVKITETTIWATTDRSIVLKGGVIMPIHRIHDIKVL